MKNTIKKVFKNLFRALLVHYLFPVYIHICKFADFKYVIYDQLYTNISFSNCCLSR